MRRPVFQNDWPGLPAIAAAIATVLVLAGSLLWFWPYLTRERQSVAGAPAPSALSSVAEFSLRPHRQACMSSVTVDPNSRFAEFQLRAPKSTPHVVPPVQLLLSAQGYRAVGQVAGGYAEGSIALPIAPPTRALIGMACFTNRGRTTVLLDGTTEPRTITRSETLIEGKSVEGDIALTFLDSRRSLLDDLGKVFGHASNLTDRLVPTWLVWVLAVLVAFCVPIGMIAAVYRALREDEATAES